MGGDHEAQTVQSTLQFRSAIVDEEPYPDRPTASIIELRPSFSDAGLQYKYEREEKSNDTDA